MSCRHKCMPQALVFGTTLAARVARCWQLSLVPYPLDLSLCTFDSRLFGVVKRSFTQCRWKGHAHRSNITFQCDSLDRCCACTAAVFKCCDLVVQSPRPPPPRGGDRRLVPPPPLGPMTICVCHGGLCELSIRCSWPPWGGNRHNIWGRLQGGRKVGKFGGQFAGQGARDSGGLDNPKC